MAEDPLSDNYQMLEELGSGSFGTVYKAIDKVTGEIVAVKHIDLESTDEDLQEVQAEISLLSTCASPFVTQYKASFLRGYKLWIVMEYLGGGSCQDLLKPGVFSEAHIAIVCQQILLGLQYLHQEGKLHRDIKAANILLSQSGKVKLADFGVAAQLVNIRSLRNTFVGTPFWMAPEVIQQSGYDFKADIWSLGITAVELIHGEPPNAGKHPMKVLMEIPKMPAPRLEGNQYSKDFKDFVAKCLIKDPDQRPSAKELLKHRFIRGAARTEALQELILRRQEWDAGLEKKETLKYYAETLRNIKLPMQAEDDDGWVFDTVKALPTLHHTQKRRKLTVTRIEDDVKDDDAGDMMEERNLSQQQPQTSTMRRLPDPPLPRSSSQSVKRSTKKRISSGQQKQPLGVNISFGNSPSTVRQFRRVSPTSNENERTDKDDSSAQSSLSPSKLRNAAPSISSADVDTENMPPPPLPARNTTRVSSRSNSSSSSTHLNTNTGTTSSSRSNLDSSSTPSSRATSLSKEATLGTYLYNTSIGPTCQEILSTTADSTKRDALSRLAESISDLEIVDPEGLYHVVKGALEKMGGDERLRSLFAAGLEGEGGAPDQRRGVGRAPGDKTPSPQKGSAGGGGGGVAGVGEKLVLAQNNPHLKSHRRRQSALVEAVGSGRGYGQDQGHGQGQSGQQRLAGGEKTLLTSSPRSVVVTIGKEGREVKEARGEEEEERAMRALMPGGPEENVKGMEHVGQLADVLFERWCEGLRGRWGGNGG